MADNLSVVLVGVKDLQVMQMPLPSAPGQGEVICKTLSVGICGTDIHFWQHGVIGGHLKLYQPTILGHEASAEIIEVGPGVNHLKVGDRVSVDPSANCQACSFCQDGRNNLCPYYVGHGCCPHHGTFTRVFKHRANLCWKIPDTMTADEAACIEPLSCGLYTVIRSGLKVGQKVLITGAGPLGIVSLMGARAFGASEISITDFNASRLESAKQIDPKVNTILLDPKDDLDAQKKKVLDSFDGEQPEVTLDCCGFESSIELGIEVTQPGGVLALTGMGQQKMNVSLIKAICKELDIRGVIRYRPILTWPLALQLIKDGKIDISKLVSHRFKLEDAVKAFETAKSGVGMKVVIDCSGK